jgi:hypothetical protein
MRQRSLSMHLSFNSDPRCARIAARVSHMLP